MKEEHKQNPSDRARYRKNDEYYTTYEHVQYVFEYLLQDVDFTGKTIYCFCDSEESNFVKYLKDNKLRLNYKELLYTWDDYNNHVDLFEKADYVITNPPFSKLSKDLVPLIHKCKNFLIFGSFLGMSIYYRKYTDISGYKQFLDRSNKLWTFITPNKEIIRQDITYITNIDKITIPPLYKYTNTFDNIENKVYGNVIACKKHGYLKDILTLDRIKDIPCDYEGYMLVPCTILSYDKSYCFDIINSHPDIGSKTDKSIKNIYSDGKSRYIRTLVKIKPEYQKKSIINKKDYEQTTETVG